MNTRHSITAGLILSLTCWLAATAVASAGSHLPKDLRLSPTEGPQRVIVRTVDAMGAGRLDDLAGRGATLHRRLSGTNAAVLTLSTVIQVRSDI